MYQQSFTTLIRLKEAINEVLDLRPTVKLFLEFVVLEIQTSFSGVGQQLLWKISNRIYQSGESIIKR